METVRARPPGMRLATYCFRASILSSSLCFSRAPIHSSNRSQDRSFSGILLRKSWRVVGDRSCYTMCCHPFTSFVESQGLCAHPLHRLCPFLPAFISLRNLSPDLSLSSFLTTGAVRPSSKGPPDLGAWTRPWDNPSAFPQRDFGGI